MRIGLAQIRSSTGNIALNITHHLDVLEKSGKSDLDLVLFHELSLSNYDPDIANAVVMESDDTRFKSFQEFVDRTGISVGVGVPIRSPSKPLISVIVFIPYRRRTIIHKSYLHEDELPYFSAIVKPVSVLKMARNIAIAICYDISVDAHIESAVEKDMDVYLACVAKTAAGIDEARNRMSVNAIKFNIPVLVVNSVGNCEGKVAGGGSMVIGSDGIMLNSLDNKEEAVLIYDFEMKNTKKIEI